ncbi:hypothetical protein [Mesorhizobium sp. M1295]|uniref:hypothetical protein n=1 Tax=Mesorhizobium sp. M1295 TaxID=2957076 RepID=UPI00333A3920
MADLNQRIVDTLARAFEDRSADRFPTLAVSCRKCRVGSTALTNLFGIAGFRPPAGQDCHAVRGAWSTWRALDRAPITGHVECECLPDGIFDSVRACTGAAVRPKNN